MNRRHRLDRPRPEIAVHADRGQEIEGRIGRGERRKTAAVPSTTPHVAVHEGEWRAGTIGLKHDDRRLAFRLQVGADTCGERLHGGRLEQPGERHSASAHLLDRREHLHREQRVPAELEEVVVDADAFSGEEERPDLYQFVLQWRTRGLVRTQVVAERLRFHQRAPVELSTRRLRQGVHHHHGGRNHVLRQAIPAPASQRGVRLTRTHAVAQHHIGNEPSPSGAFSGGGHRARGHVRRLREHALDFAELHAKAANLDLVIRASEVVERSVGADARKIARAVQPRPRCAARRRNEPLFCTRRIVEIAVGECQSAEMELAGQSVGYGLAQCVEHMR